MTAPAPARSNRTLWLILAVCAAPMVAALVAYFLMPPPESKHYGELLPTQPAPVIAGTRADGSAWKLSDERGHWVMIFAAPADCDPSCATRLYATRQARTMQGKDRERVARVWLVTGEHGPSEAVLAGQPDLGVVRVDRPAADSLPRGSGPIYLVDPLGNQVLAWPADPDIARLAKDLAKLLRNSRIG